jgi:very-short-patch-repair endonuclease/AraC-like DNA-binding protein
MTYFATKKQLENDYFILNLTHQEIAEKYGFKTRQVISRVFKKYGIQSKLKSQVAKEKADKNINHITKKDLQKLYQTKSISQIAKLYGVHRSTLSNLFDNFEIEKIYFKNNIDNNVLYEKSKTLSLKEISIQYAIKIKEIKRRIKNVPIKLYNKDRLIKIIMLYDLNSPNFARDIKEDLNVYNSIIELTKTHFLQSNKITEKVYHLLNNYKNQTTVTCKKCNSTLKFYTLKNGYGNTDHNICRNCISSISGSSKPSQELFWKLYTKLNFPKKCNFSELNNERTLYINQDDILNLIQYKKLNKKRYHIDFMLENKIIEYDGEYWHNDLEKETTKNKFLKNKGYSVLHIKDSEYKKNPEKVIEDCLQFLTK